MIHKSSSHSSEHLSAQQISLLRYFQLHPQSELPLSISPVAAEHLIEQGLLERVRILSLPDQPLRYHFRLTPRGRAALENR